MERPRPLFLFSLPRTGSTMLQAMLAEHSKISTPNETWLLLPLLYSLRPKGVYAEYGHAAAAAGIGDLCTFLRGGRRGYQEELKELALRIYDRASPPGSAYFLDKTPRYHLIVDDILALFDEGRFLFLWRNPLAVVASMIESGSGLGPHRVDLFAGAANLVDAFNRHADRCLAIRYEDLVEAPKAQTARIFNYLELPAEDGVTSVADRAPLTKWQTTLATPLRRRWCQRYLRWLGAERLATMGYARDDLEESLAMIPRRAGGAADFALAAQQVASPLLEPAIVRDKIARLAGRHPLYQHS